MSIVIPGISFLHNIRKKRISDLIVAIGKPV
jgi:hypothetical protein